MIAEKVRLDAVLVPPQAWGSGEFRDVQEEANLVPLISSKETRALPTGVILEEDTFTIYRHVDGH